MKNKLPEVLGSFTTYQVGLHRDGDDNSVEVKREDYLLLKDTTNKLIDCLAELTTVVEGEMEPKRHCDGGECTCEKKNYIEPSKGEWVSLKETLLGKLRNEAYRPWDTRDGTEGAEDVINLSDVEAIINRLLP